jgi:hypothetical protein
MATRMTNGGAKGAMSEADIGVVVLPGIGDPGQAGTRGEIGHQQQQEGAHRRDDGPEYDSPARAGGRRSVSRGGEKGGGGGFAAEGSPGGAYASPTARGIGARVATPTGSTGMMEFEASKSAS